MCVYILCHSPLLSYLQITSSSMTTPGPCTAPVAPPTAAADRRVPMAPLESHRLTHPSKVPPL